MKGTLLHTRLVTLRLTWADGGTVLADGRLVDIRKRGIVPLAGALRGPGVVHDMGVRVWVDPQDLSIRRIEPAMRAYPFAPSSRTCNEGCPNRLDDVQHLVGIRLDRAYGDTVTEHIGGPRGCFHIFTLLRLLGPSVVWALRGGAQPHARAPQPAPDSPIFARSMIVDGLLGDGLQIDLHGTLCDITYPPGAESLPLEEELESGFEAAGRLAVALPEMKAVTANAQVRDLGPGVGQAGPWTAVPAVEQLAGVSLRKGYSANVQQRLGDGDGTRPLTHLLLLFAPVLLQCMPSLIDVLDLRPRRVEGPHPATDSCHMWRSGGPLLALYQG
jgi:hypothetical protein